MAYVLIAALRRIGLRHTQFADATCGSIRLKLLKIGALVTKSVRRIKFAMASGCPWGTSSGSPTPSSPLPCADEPDTAQPKQPEPIRQSAATQSHVQIRTERASRGKIHQSHGNRPSQTRHP
jgi:hypothetical protein